MPLTSAINVGSGRAGGSLTPPGGTITPGRHLVHKKNTPLCNLFVSMLDRMGAPTPQFGDSTQPLKGLDDPNWSGDGA